MNNHQHTLCPVLRQLHWLVVTGSPAYKV